MTPQDASFTQRAPGHWHAHATAVAFEGCAMVILGASGAGKSSLAAGMIALGCTLVADDAVHLRDMGDGALTCSAPETLPALLEMRGFGLLPVPLTASARLICCVQLSDTLPDRFPPEVQIVFDHSSVPLYTVKAHASLAAQAFLLLKSGCQTLRA